MNSFLHLGVYLFEGDDFLIAYLRGKHLLASSMTCTRCGIPMHEVTRSDVRDGLRWWCRQCKTSKSIRDGIFFLSPGSACRSGCSLFTCGLGITQYVMWHRRQRWTRILHVTSCGGLGKCALLPCLGLLINLVDQGRWYKLMSLFRHKPKVNK